MKQLTQKTVQVAKKTKTTLKDYFRLLFRSAADNHLHIQQCKTDPSGKIYCTIVFESYAALKRYQKRLRRVTLSLSGTVALIFISVFVTQLMLPVFKSKAATYDWIQAVWTTESAGTQAVHPGDATGWDTYDSKDSRIVAGASVTLDTAGGSPWIETADADFTGSFSQTELDGTAGAGSSVILSQIEDLLMVSAGSSHTCAVKNDGTTWCWGYNGSGQLGDGTTTQSLTPVQVLVSPGGAGVTGIQSISAGDSHTCAVKTDGTAWCWGSNGSGQLGDGTTTTPRTTPVQVLASPGGTGVTGIQSVSAGDSHTCATKTDGTTWCWGYNGSGQLGDGTTTQSLTPVQVLVSPGGAGVTGIQSISAGDSHTCAVKTDGTAWCWGSNGSGQLGDGTTTTPRTTPVQVLASPGGTGVTGIQSVSAGDSHTCATKTDGTAWCWGSNGSGQLGDGTTTGSYTPVQVLASPGGAGITGIQSVSAGGSHTCAVKSDGTAWCWGWNNSGRLGDGTTTQRTTPVQVLASPFGSGVTGIQSVSAGYQHTCATKTDGTAWCWGSNFLGQLGDGTTADRWNPVQVKGEGGAGFLADMAQISAGDYHTCATKTDGTAWCWGSNGNGKLGDNTVSSKYYPSQVVQLALYDFTGVGSVSAGSSHACAVKTDGTAWCWGTGNWGRLGYGRSGNSSVPVQVRNNQLIGTLNGVVSVSAGYGHTCAVKTDGSARCWGGNSYGQLGYDITGDSDTPLTVKGPGGTGTLSDVQSIAAGDDHTCAVKTDGTAWCWGYNFYGQLGDGTTNQRLTPVQVLASPGGEGVTGVQSIAAGDDHTCAVKTDGTAWCWGANLYGQLGDGTTNQRLTPVQVLSSPGGEGVTGVQSISAGRNHTCATKTDGTAWCWGYNDYGKLGIGYNGMGPKGPELTQELTPVQVKGEGGTGFLTAVAQISAGSTHTCATKTNGTAWCWGLNFYGQLGDGTTTQRETPVQVLDSPGGAGVTNIQSVSAGYQHTCATKTDGTAWCWGSNTDGRLGDGTTIGRYNPVRAPLHQAVEVFSLASGDSYHASGTYTSTVRDTASNGGWGTFDWSDDALHDITVKFRSCDDASCSAAGTVDESATKDWSLCTAFSRADRGSALTADTTCVTDGDRYLQYQTTLSGDGSGTPAFQDITLSYYYSGTLNSSVYDSSSADTVITALGISGTLPAGTRVRGQVRSSVDAASWTDWCGPSACDADGTYDYDSSYVFDFSGDDLTNGTLKNFLTGHPFLNGGGETDDQYFQYRLILESSTTDTPTITQSDVQYVVNAAPQVAGVSASQDATGLVNVSYSLADEDNSSQTVHFLADLGITLNEELADSDTAAVTLSDASRLPASGIVQIEKEQISYTAKSGNDLAGTITRGVNNTVARAHASGQTVWFRGTTVNVDGAGSTGSVSGISTDLGAPTSLSGSWNIKTDLDGVYYPAARIRVSANDANAANAVGNGDSDVAGFALDTKDPVVNTFLIGSSTPDAEKTNDNTENLSLDATEDTASGFQMQFSNDGATWSGWEDYATSKSQWDFTAASVGGDGTEGQKTVYVQLRDAKGNLTQTSDTITYDITDPGAPDKLKVQDASNELTGVYKTFLSWESVADTDGDFARYRLYFNTSPNTENNPTGSWTEIDYAEATQIGRNYYVHDNLTSTSRYYYRLTSEDDIGNVSGNSSSVDTVPDGSGGSGLTPPAIDEDSVSIDANTTWAKIVWNTGANDLSTSRVHYKVRDGADAVDTNDPSVLVDSMRSLENESNGTRPHEVILANLTPDATYDILLVSRDINGNSDTYQTTFDTLDQPRISSLVTVTETTNTTATLRWETDTAADTYVAYAASKAGAAAATPEGTDEAVTGHAYTIEGLAANTRYFFYVKSGSTTDKNPNLATGDFDYYTLTTTNDTAPPVITASGAPIGEPILKTDTKAVIRFSTDEKAQSRVVHKKGSGSYSDPDWSGSSNLAHIMVLENLERDTAYTYRIEARDVNGNAAQSAEYSFTTLQQQKDHPDLTDPGDPAAANLLIATHDQAVIKWATNTSSTARLCYDTSRVTDMENCASAVDSDDPSTLHVFNLEGLDPATLYFYRIKTTDSENPEITFTSADSESIYFTTQSFGDTTPPSLESYTVVETTEQSATISVTASESAIAFVQFLDTRTDFSDDYHERSSSKAYGLSHTITLSNLQAEEKYYFRIKLQDQSGNTAVYPATDYYEFTTAVGPKITEGPACVADQTRITIAWETDKNADSYVLYGTDSALASYFKLGKDTKEKDHSVTVEGLFPYTDYYYQVKSQSSGGGVSSSAIKSCQTLEGDVDSSAPSISNVQAILIGRNQALINWNTDKPSTSQVAYGGEEGVYGSATKENTDMVTNHYVVVESLTAGTTYHYQVISADASGNREESDDYTFKTLGVAADEGTINDVLKKIYSPPTISSPSATVSRVDGTSVTISWSTDKEATSMVAYKPETAIGYREQGVSAQYVTEHEVTLANLSPNTKYFYYVKSVDVLGNSGQSEIGTFTTSPTSNIFNVQVIDITYDSATVSWESSVDTSTWVEYGKSSSYGEQTRESSGRSKAHAVKLDGLDAGATYHFVMKGRDRSENLYSSSEYTFSTPAPPVITDFKLDSITENEMRVRFSTNIETDSFVILINTEDEEDKHTQGNPDFKEEHVLRLTQLDSGTTYTLEVQVRDRNGNTTVQRIDDYTTAVDENPPKIDQLRVATALAQADKVQTIISWVTDEPATTSILYKEATEKNFKEVEFDADHATKHTIVLTSFKPGTVYRYKAKSIDKAGNVSISEEYAVLTPRKKENIIQIIIGNFQDIFGWMSFVE